MHVTVDHTDYSIDILTHRPDGERYIAKTCSVWEDNECLGYAVVAMAGELSEEDIERLRHEPENWDSDNAFDVNAVNAELSRGGDSAWLYSEELS